MASTRNPNVSIVQVSGLSDPRTIPITAFTDGGGSLRTAPRGTSVKISSNGIHLNRRSGEQECRAGIRQATAKKPLDLLMLNGVGSSGVADPGTRELSPVRWCNRDVDGVYLGKSGWVQIQQRSLDEGRKTVPAYKCESGFSTLPHRTTAQCNGSPRDQPRPVFLPLDENSRLYKSPSPLPADFESVSPPVGTPIISPPPAFRDLDRVEMDFQRKPDKHFSRSNALVDAETPPDSPPKEKSGNVVRLKKLTSFPVSVPNKHGHSPRPMHQTKSMEYDFPRNGSPVNIYCDPYKNQTAFYHNADRSAFDGYLDEDGDVSTLPLKFSNRERERLSSRFSRASDAPKNGFSANGVKRNGNRYPLVPLSPSSSTPSTVSSSSDSPTPSSSPSHSPVSFLLEPRPSSAGKRKSVKTKPRRQESPSQYGNPAYGVSNNNLNVRRSRSLQLSEKQSPNQRYSTSAEKKAWSPMSEFREIAEMASSLYRPMNDCGSVSVASFDRAQRHGQNEKEEKKQKILQEAAEEVQIVSDFLSGTRSREAARNLLWDRYMNRPDAEGQGIVKSVPRNPEYGVHFIGAYRRPAGNKFNSEPQCCSGKEYYDSGYSSLASSNYGTRSPAVGYRRPDPPQPEPVKPKPHNHATHLIIREKENVRINGAPPPTIRDNSASPYRRLSTPLAERAPGARPAYANTAKHGGAEKNHAEQLQKIEKNISLMVNHGAGYEGPYERASGSLPPPASISPASSHRRVRYKKASSGYASANQSSITSNSFSGEEDFPEPRKASATSRRPGSVTPNKQDPGLPDAHQRSLSLPKSFLSHKNGFKGRIDNTWDVSLSKSASTDLAEESPTGTPEHSEKVLNKFKKSISNKFSRGKGLAKNHCGSVDYIPASELNSNNNNNNRDACPEKSQNSGKSGSVVNSKFRFGPLIWKQNKTRRRNKQRLGNASAKEVKSVENIADGYSSVPSGRGQLGHSTDAVNNQHGAREDGHAEKRIRRTNSDLVGGGGGGGTVGGHKLPKWESKRPGKSGFPDSPAKERFHVKTLTKFSSTGSLDRCGNRSNASARDRMRRSISYPLELNKSSSAKNELFGIRSLSDEEYSSSFYGTSENDLISESESSIGSPINGRQKYMDATTMEAVMLAESLWDRTAIEPDEASFRTAKMMKVLGDRDWWWRSSDERFRCYPSDLMRINQGADGTEDRLPGKSHGSSHPRRKTNISMLSNDQVRTSVVRELVNTERDFVKVLRDITEGYVAECGKRGDLFTGEQVEAIFGNLGDLLTFQRTFLADLESRIDQESPNKSCIGDIFLKHRLGFGMYSDYCNSYPTAVATLQEMYASPPHAKFFEECRLTRGLIKIPLDGYLLTPVQRICKYPLQLAELLKCTKPDHPDHVAVREAFEAMKNVATVINERKRKMENLEKIADWQSRVEGWEGEDLVVTSSQLIHQGDAVRVNSGVWTNNVTLFLFDYQLVYCKKDLLKRNIYVYKGRIFLDSADVINLPNGKNEQHGATIKHGIKIYNFAEDKWLVFCCRSEEDKAKWLKAFADERKLVAQDKIDGLELPKSTRQLVKLTSSPKHRPNKPKRKTFKVDPNYFNTFGMKNGRKVGTWFTFGGGKRNSRINFNPGNSSLYVI